MFIRADDIAQALADRTTADIARAEHAASEREHGRDRQGLLPDGSLVGPPTTGGPRDQYPIQTNQNARDEDQEAREWGITLWLSAHYVSIFSSSPVSGIRDSHTYESNTG